MIIVAIGINIPIAISSVGLRRNDKEPADLVRSPMIASVVRLRGAHGLGGGKNIAKDLRYEKHRIFLEEYGVRKLGRLGWSCTQANSTVGVHGSIKTEDFDERLAGLGIHEKKVREVIAMRTVRKTLEQSDAMLSIFHLSIRTNPEWAKHAVSETLANTITERYNLFKRFTGPIGGFGI